MSRSLSRRSVLATTATATATATAAAAATATAAAVGGPLATATPAYAAPALPDGTSEDKVLVVGMDGLRHDVIDAARAPHLKSTMANGTYGTSLLYADPMAAASSGPGWSTIATGVWPDKHGVKDNSFAGKNYGKYPGFLARLAQVRPQLSTYAAVDSASPPTTGGRAAGAPASSPPGTAERPSR